MEDDFFLPSSKSQFKKFIIVFLDIYKLLSKFKLFFNMTKKCKVILFLKEN